MADILEDQRIHNIVKDYKRMYDEHNKLIEIGKQLQKELIAKDKQLTNARAELANIKAKCLHEDKPIKAIKGQLGEIEARTNSVSNNILTATKRLEGIFDNIEQIKELLKS